MAKKKKEDENLSERPCTYASLPSLFFQDCRSSFHIGFNNKKLRVQPRRRVNHGWGREARLEMGVLRSDQAEAPASFTGCALSPPLLSRVCMKAIEIRLMTVRNRYICRLNRARCFCTANHWVVFKRHVFGNNEIRMDLEPYGWEETVRILRYRTIPAQ